MVATARRSSVEWHAVPTPSPWPGVQSGETIRKRCYAWIQSAKKRRHKLAVKKGTISDCNTSVPVRVGSMARGLQTATPLNGLWAHVLTAPDDQDRVTVLVQDMDHPVWLQNARLVSDSAECGSQAA